MRAVAARRLDLGELRAFVDGAAHPQTERDQHGAAEERHAPAPTVEVGGRERLHEQKRGGGQHEAERRAARTPGRERTAPRGGRVFVNQQDAAAPFAAGGEALQDAQQHQQDGCRDADLLIGRQQTHADGGRAHDEQRQHHDRLAAVAVADMAAQHAADGPRDEAHRKAAECRDRARQRIAADGKEQLAEHERGGGSIEKEVIPFEDLPEHGGRHRATNLAGGPGCGQGCQSGCRVRIHGGSWQVEGHDVEGRAFSP